MKTQNTVATITQITQGQLATMLAGIKGTVLNTTIEYFVDESKSRVIKGEKQVQKLVKISNVTLGSNYENKVNRIAENKQGMEANFEAQQMSGTELVGGALVRSIKSGELRIYGCVENFAKPETTYYYKGEVKTVEQLKELDVLAPSFFAEKPTMGRGLVDKDNDFGLISTKLSNIRKLKMKGLEFEVLPV